ncbi:MAG: hypothetical protein U1F43_29675 [Myxococcota bacterium]
MSTARALAVLALAVSAAAAGCTPRVSGEKAEVEVDGTTWLLPPNVSHSRGVDGGVVLLWPRVIPSAELERVRPMAAALQERLMGLVTQAYPGRPVDRRPEPERVCPPNGCAGIAVGVLLAVRGDSCYAVAVVSAPGRAPQQLTPWAGTVSAEAEIPFRAHPEEHVHTQDYVPCALLLDQARERDDRVRAALDAVRPD